MIIAISRLFSDYFRTNALINRFWTFNIFRSGKIAVARERHRESQILCWFWCLSYLLWNFLERSRVSELCVAVKTH